jgi:hypothetical protein
MNRRDFDRTVENRPPLSFVLLIIAIVALIVILVLYVAIG